MKRQFFLDHIERDMLRTALGYFAKRIDADCSGYSAEPAGKFTRRRIDELLARLQEPTEGHYEKHPHRNSAWRDVGGLSVRGGVT